MAEPNRVDYYQLLGVLPTATPAEIQESYLRQQGPLRLQAQAGDAAAAERLRLLDEGYGTLADAGRRTEYDRTRGDGTPGGALVVTAPAIPTVLLAPSGPSPVLQRACRHCGAVNPASALMCAQCREQLTRPCPNCGHPNELERATCERCTIVIAEYDTRRATEGLATANRVTMERQASGASAVALEDTHHARALSGTAFWIVVLVGALALVAVAVLVVWLFAVAQVNP